LEDFLKELQRQLYSDDWEIALAASDRLAELGGEGVIDHLLEALESPFKKASSAAALALRELQAERAKAPLLALIADPAKRNFNGTYVWALINLDTRDLFLYFIHMALYDDFECKCKALMALRDNDFLVNRQQLVTAVREVKKFKRTFSPKPEQWELLVDELEEIVELATTLYRQGIGGQTNKKQAVTISLASFFQGNSEENNDMT